MKKTIAFLLLSFCSNTFSQSVEVQNDNLIYDIKGIEVEPTFPGGLEQLNSYINENFQKVVFDTEIKAKPKTKSTTFSTFVIEKDGLLSDIKIYGKGKVDPRKSEEWIRILKSLPKWNPGKQNGKLVRVLYALPLTEN
jgi:protein TonB